MQHRLHVAIVAAIISIILNIILVAALINEQRLYRAAVAERDLLSFDAMRAERQLSSCMDEKSRLRRGKID